MKEMDENESTFQRIKKALAKVLKPPRARRKSADDYFLEQIPVGIPPDEHIYFITRGRYEVYMRTETINDKQYPFYDRYSGLVAITARRVRFCGGFFFSWIKETMVEDVMWNRVDSVQLSTKRDISTIKIHYMNNQRNISISRNASKIQPLYLTVQKAMNEANASRPYYSVDLADQFERIANPVSKGVLQPEDMQRLKNLFLGRQPSKGEEAVLMLEQLYSLYKGGILSQSEYNLKKWDILSRANP